MRTTSDMNCILFFCQREYVCTCSDVVTCTTVVEAHAVRALPSRIPDREGVEAFLPSPLGVSMQQSRHSRQFWLDLTLIYVHGSLPRFREFAQISRTFGREFKKSRRSKERERERESGGAKRAHIANTVYSSYLVYSQTRESPGWRRSESCVFIRTIYL